jgi:hypothetical protein
LDSTTLTDLAGFLHSHFTKELQRVFTVVDPEAEADVSKKEGILILDLKLAATFEHEEVGLLTGWMRKKMRASASQGVPFTLECTLWDGVSGEKIAVLTDTQEIFSKDPGAPMSTPEENDQLLKTFGVWASRLNHYLRP